MYCILVKNVDKPLCDEEFNVITFPSIDRADDYIKLISYPMGRDLYVAVPYNEGVKVQYKAMLEVEIKRLHDLIKNV